MEDSRAKAGHQFSDASEVAWHLDLARTATGLPGHRDRQPLLSTNVRGAQSIADSAGDAAVRRVRSRASIPQREQGRVYESARDRPEPQTGQARDRHKIV